MSFLRFLRCKNPEGRVESLLLDTSTSSNLLSTEDTQSGISKILAKTPIAIDIFTSTTLDLNESSWNVLSQGKAKKTYLEN